MTNSKNKVRTTSTGAANFRNAKLVVEGNTAVISPTFRSYSFWVILSSAIWFAFIFIAVIAYEDKGMESLKFISIMGVCLFLFDVLILFIALKVLKPKRFDKDSGLFYVGMKPDEKSSIKLSDICALHLTSRKVRFSESSCRCHELSLSTSDGKRVSLINHSIRHHVKEESELLSKFLGVECEIVESGDAYK